MIHVRGPAVPPRALPVCSGFPGPFFVQPPLHQLLCPCMDSFPLAPDDGTQFVAYPLIQSSKRAFDLGKAEVGGDPMRVIFYNMPQRLKYGHSQTMMAKTAKTTEAVIALCMLPSSILTMRGKRKPTTARLMVIMPTVQTARDPVLYPMRIRMMDTIAGKIVSRMTSPYTVSAPFSQNRCIGSSNDDPPTT